MYYSLSECQSQLGYGTSSGDSSLGTLGNWANVTGTPAFHLGIDRNILFLYTSIPKNKSQNIILETVVDFSIIYI